MRLPEALPTASNAMAALDEFTVTERRPGAAPANEFKRVDGFERYDGRTPTNAVDLAWLKKMAALRLEEAKASDAALPKLAQATLDKMRQLRTDAALAREKMNAQLDRQAKLYEDTTQQAYRDALIYGTGITRTTWGADYAEMCGGKGIKVERIDPSAVHLDIHDSGTTTSSPYDQYASQTKLTLDSAKVAIAQARVQAMLNANGTLPAPPGFKQKSLTDMLDEWIKKVIRPDERTTSIARENGKWIAYFGGGTGYSSFYRVVAIEP